MTKRRLLASISLGLCAAAGLAGVTYTRAGVMQRKSFAPTSGAIGRQGLHPFPRPSSPGRAEKLSGQDAMDAVLIKGWSEALYKGYRPKVQKELVSGPYVALTFDDGPKRYGTPLILDTLQRYNAHATFFVVGKQCALNPDLVARMVEGGHEIGNHTYDHYRLPTISIEQVADELERTRKIIHQITGETTYLFRPPGGRTNADVQTVADSLGYTTVFWRLDSGELSGDMDPDKVYHRIVDHIRGGDIVLLHNGDPNILAALPRIMETLTSQGYTFVTVSELMKMSGSQPEESASAPGGDAEWDSE